MAKYRPKPLPETLDDLPHLCREVEARLHEGFRKSWSFKPFTDSPGQALLLKLIIAGCDVVFVLSWIAAAIAFAFSTTACVILFALGFIAVATRLYVHIFILRPRQRRLRKGRVIPAVVVQAYPGGYLPPAEDPDTPMFGGIVVYSHDVTMSADALIKLAARSFEAKEDTHPGELAGLKKMLIAGDETFERTAFHFPQALAGNNQTYATPVMWDRDHDLIEGHLCTDLQLMYGHPKTTDNVCPVPVEYWASARSFELLSL